MISEKQHSALYLIKFYNDGNWDALILRIRILSILSTKIQGGTKVGLQLWIHEMEFFLVLLFINYCISFHTNNYKPTFAPAVCSLLFKERDCGPTFICYKIVKGDAKGAVSETPFPCKSSPPSETHSTQSSQRLCPMCDLRSAAQIWSDRKWRLFSLAQTCTFSSSTQMSQFCRWAKTRVTLKGPEWTLNLSTQNYQRMAWMYIYPMVRLLFKKLLLNLAVFYQQWLSEARWHHYDLSVYSLTLQNVWIPFEICNLSTTSANSTDFNYDFHS